MENFKALLAGSAKAHGHLCPGQVVGVRMAILGLKLIGLDDPRNNNDEIKKLIVYVEMDRCTADAVSYVTGARLGRRSLKFKDYGIMAATFLNLEKGTAFRIISTEEARDLAGVYAPYAQGKYQKQLEAYKHMPDSVLFRVEEVEVNLKENDLPGPTRFKAICSRCGQIIRDKKEIIHDGKILCVPCSGKAYFTGAREISWPDMNWKPYINENGKQIDSSDIHNSQKAAKT